MAKKKQPIKTCRECRFWAVPDRVDWAGQCRRSAPETGSDGPWPLTYRDGWCGCYEPKLGRGD